MKEYSHCGRWSSSLCQRHLGLGGSERDAADFCRLLAIICLLIFATSIHSVSDFQMCNRREGCAS